MPRPISRALFAGLFRSALALTATTSARARQTGFWGDQGDGTYRNPVIAGDYSDPDVIRVGENYFLVASTFESSPGVTLLHSRDLVNWQSLGGAIPDLAALGSEPTWRRMGHYNSGIYAPAIRHHAGTYHVYAPAFGGEGLFVCTATDPRGPWIVTRMKDKNGKPLRVRGWTDPCPFWDDDGKAYLAASKPGGKWFTYLFEMTPDGTQLLDADADHLNIGNIVYEYPRGGTLLIPHQSAEGTKIYKRNGYYYFLHIQFTRDGSGQGSYIHRARHLYGTKPDGAPGKPGDLGAYEIIPFATAGGGGQDIPGQGGLVDTPDGRWFYIAQFNRYGSDGRSPHLLPVTWIDDWPVIGAEPDATTKRGKMAWQLPKPIPGQPVQLPLGGDEFESPALHPRWQWNHQPRADKWSLTERPGFLRLHAFKPAGHGFFKAGNTLNQRHLRSESAVVTALVDISGLADGQEAGLARFNGGRDHACLAVIRRDGVSTIHYKESVRGRPEIPPTVGPALPQGASTLWLRSTVGFDDQNAYAYSLDGKTFTPFGGAYRLRPAGFRGDMVGLYTFNPAGEAGYFDVASFAYEVTHRRAEGVSPVAWISIRARWRLPGRRRAGWQTSLRQRAPG